MKGTDRILIGIVVAVLAVAAIAVAVALLQPPPSYRAGDTPESVVYNYMLAVQREDYARAYGYLSPTLPGYPPDTQQFTEDLLRDSSSSFARGYDMSLEVESVELQTGNLAIVRLKRTMIYGEGSLLGDNSYSLDERVRLKRNDGAWQIIEAEWFWNRCWDAPESTRCRG